MKSLLAKFKLIMGKLLSYSLVVVFGMVVTLLTYEIQRIYGNPFKNQTPQDPLTNIRMSPPEYVNIIYHKLVLVSGHQGEMGQIFLLPSFAWNAMVNEYHNVYLFFGLVGDMKNNDELAFIIAHEIAHVMLGHTEGKGHHDSRIDEYHSDMLAIALMQRAGYDPCVVSGLWKRLSKYAGTDIMTKSHPASIQRAEYTKLPQCIKVEK